MLGLGPNEPPKKDRPPGKKPSGQTNPNELHIRGPDPKREQSEQRWGSGARPAKIFATTPFRSLESAPFCKEVAIERGGTG